MNKLLCIFKTILIEIKATAKLQASNDKPGLPQFRSNRGSGGLRPPQIISEIFFLYTNKWFN